MSKEPGRSAFDAMQDCERPWPITWSELHPDVRVNFARVESTIRADERAKVIEECAKIAEDAKRAAPLCPYGRDKPGDPTWNHTDDDICPVCRKNGHDSLHTCTDALSGNIAAALRSKIGESNG